MKTFLKHTVILLIFLAFEACGDKNLKTVTLQPSGNYSIAILSSDGSIEQGSGKFYIEFRDVNNNQPVDVGEVQVQASMPMPGMPMVNDGKVEASDKSGRYSVKYDLSMSGSWTLNVRFGNKSVAIPITVN